MLENIALEHAITEYQHKNSKLPTIRIWRNTKSVVIGRNQVYQDEVDETYCRSHDIGIMRRISGGGAVYHDLGNYNISIYGPVKSFSSKYNIIEVSNNITKSLHQVLEGLYPNEVDIYNKTSILYKGKKISGSANYLVNNWFLHHLTILQDANLHHLEHSLIEKGSNLKQMRKSKYYPTINLKDLDINEFLRLILLNFNLTYDIHFEEDELMKEEINLARHLVNNLYSKNSWIKQGKRKS